MSDRSRLYAAAFLRALATGLLGVILGLHLARLGVTPAAIGLVVGAGLAGATCASLIATLGADRLGRRRFLLGLAVCGAAGALAVTGATGALTAGIGAFLGMLSGMGRDRGAALVLEQAILPATTADTERTRAFAWYNVLQDAGHALGALLAIVPGAAGGTLAGYRVGLGLYATLILATAFLYRGLSAAVETGHLPRLRVSPGSRRVLWRISSLFALDSVGGGFLTTALLSLFFHERFGVGVGLIGLLFFVARVANMLSHLAAAWLARRVGLLNTMVLTHVPSSLLLVTVPFAPSFPIAAALFVLREGLVEMDVPTRQSYVMAVVRPEERTVASGVTHLVRTGGWAIGPSIAGALMQDVTLATPLFVGAGLKLAYDVLLYAAFRRTLPPEEVRAPSRAPGS